MEEAIVNAKEAKPRNRFLATACAVLAGLCVLIPAAFWKGGVLDGEAIMFVINYADDRTPLQKVFNPQLNDFNTFQARELSFLFDYLDAASSFSRRHFDVAFHSFKALVRRSDHLIYAWRRQTAGIAV